MRKLILTPLVVLTSLIAVTAVKAESGTYYNAVTNLSPVIYLPLDETTPPPATKPAAVNLGSLGTADNGTYSDGAFPGVPGALIGDTDTAGLFSGATGNEPRVTAPYDPAYATNTTFTVELWVNSAIQDPGTECVASCLDAGSPRAGWLVYAGIAGPGTFTFRTYNTNGTTAAISYNIAIPGGHLLSDTWYHLAVTLTDGTNAQAYVDGQAATNTGTASNYVASTAGVFTIGARSDAALAFPGFIDEVAFYPTVLAASDISNHYAAGITGPSGAYKALVVADNPLLYYRLDDAAAPVAQNYGSAGSFANGYYESGVTVGTAGTGTGLPGMGGANSVAVSFGAGQATDVGVSVPVVGAAGLAVGTGNSPISFTLWSQENTPAWFTTVAGKGDQAYRFDVEGTGEGNTGHAHFNAGGNAGTFNEIVGSDVVADGKWHFLAGTWDGSNVMTLYVDGNQVAQSTNNSGTAGNSQPLTIGTCPDDTGRNFDGSICQVAIFSTALTAEQVQTLYFAAGGIPPEIVSQPMDSVVLAGSNITFSVSATGFEPLTYQWYSGYPTGPGNLVAGATNSTLTFSNATTAVAGSYFVVITDGNGLTTTTGTSPNGTAYAGALLNVISTPLPGTYFSEVVGLNPIAYWPLTETTPPPPVATATNIGTMGAAGNAYYSDTGVSAYQAPGALADTNTADTNFSITTSGTALSAQVPYSPALSNPPPFTVEAWLNTSAPAAEQSPLNCVDPGGTRSGWLIYMDATAAGIWNFRTYYKNGGTVSDGGSGVTAATAVNAGEWHHLVAVVDTNGNPTPNANGVYPSNSITVNLYLDGVLTGTSATNGASGQYAMNDWGSFCLGGRSDAAFYYEGGIDEVAYYPVALSASTIAAHYAAATTANPAQPYYQTVLASPEGAPTLFFQLDEPTPPGYPSESSDPVANNYGATGANDPGYYLPGAEPAAVAGPSVAGFPETGSQNLAVHFSHDFENTDTGFIDVPEDGFNSLNLTGPMSIAAWVKADPNFDGRFESFLGRSDSSYRMDVDGGDAVHFADQADGAGDLVGVSPGGIVNDGNWHFIVGLWDGSEQKLYVDGLLNTEGSATGNGGTVINENFNIGADPQYDTSRMFDGDVTEVALFDYALSAQQVMDLWDAASVAPRITNEPPATEFLGYSTTDILSVGAYGTPNLTYQWQFNGSPVSGPEFSGANTADLKITGATGADTGSYTVVVSNAFGSVTSAVSVVTVSLVPVITQPLPAVTHVALGGTLTLTVGLVGEPPFTNAWYLNGNLLTNGGFVSGATTTTLTISNASPEDVGTYTFTTTNAYGNAATSGSVLVDEEPTFDNNAAGWTANTQSGAPVTQGRVNNNVVEMTDGGGGEGTDFWYNSPMWIHAFKASFTYEDVGSTGVANATADGFAFVIQNTAAGASASETGNAGSGLAYYQMTNSIALTGELYNNSDNAPGIDIATNGQPSAGVTAGGYMYGPTGNVSLISGDPIDFVITYDGNNYGVKMTDETTSDTFSTNYVVGAIWETNILDSDTAFVGFTAATGGVAAVQDISNFSFVPIISLSIVSSGGGQIVFGWPTGTALASGNGGYSIQESSSLLGPWTTVPGPYTVVGNQYQYTATPGPGGNFYRLTVAP